MSTDRELDRVLANPDNVIISKSLENILDPGPEEQIDIEESRLIVGSDFLLCRIVKATISQNDVIFSVQAPAFSLKNLLVCEDLLRVHYENLVYEQIPSSDISWEDNLLTLKTRRIFNETV